MYKPGYAVQARELSQIQSLIQDQISKLGHTVIQEGACVVPGAVSLNTAYQYLQLQPTFSASPINLANFAVGKTIVGTTSKTIATIVQAVAVDGSDPNTLYISVTSGASSQAVTGTVGSSSAVVTGLSVDATTLTLGTSVSGTYVPAGTFIIEIISSSSVRLNNTATNIATETLTLTTGAAFTNAETITTVEASYLSASYSATTAASGATGTGSCVQIQQGVYFVNGYMCLVLPQTLLLDKYGSTPSYKVGLSIIDSFVTAAQDITLNDPAQGSPNFNAPGADRYQIDLTLSKLAPTVPNPADFIQLLSVAAGVIQNSVSTTPLSTLQKTLARRTYDESGDYTVKFFPLQVREHLNDGSNNGVYTASEGGDATKLVLCLGPGKAYVKGYEIKTTTTELLPIDKAQDTNTATNFSVGFIIGDYVEVSHLHGTFDITNNVTLNLYSATGYTGGSVIGTAKIRGQEYIDGTPGTTGATYNLYLYDIAMTSSNLFSAVKSIGTSTLLYANTVLDSNGDAVIESADLNTSIIPVPEYAIEDFTSVGYTIRRSYTSQAMAATTLTLTAGAGELFVSPTALNYDYQVSIVTPSGYALTQTNPETSIDYAAGDTIDLNAAGNSVALSGSPTGQQVVITIPGISGSTISVIATVAKANMTAKTKTLTTVTETALSVDSENIVQLSNADGFTLISVIDNSTSQNITSHFTFDNGQKDNYYDRSSLTFNTNYPLPATTVNVEYTYFAHSVGDYFSVNSYPFPTSMSYGDIPFYTSSVGSSYDLLVCLDFRPRINNAGNGFSVLSGLPIPDSAILVSYVYYLSRLDMIILNPDGTFDALAGSSAVSPTPPAAPAHAMVLYNLTIPPYTFNTQDVKYTMVDNKRYTMRDIGNLANRITNLEYYTSLSLLETATSNLVITDTTGANAFKNGFIVDNFTTFNVANVTTVDFLFSLDTAAGVLRPQYAMNNVDFELNTADSSNYQQTGSLITLPYTTTPFITQPFASTTENINPYAMFNWVGSLTLSPSSDDWYDTQNAPNVVITDNSGYNAALAAENGTVVWNDWTTAWTGTPVTTPDGPVAVAGGGNALGGPGQGVDSRVLSGLLATYGRLPQIAYNIPSGGHNTGYAVGVYNDIVSTQVGQVRTGTQTTVTTNTTNQTIGSQIINQATIPYMRSQNVHFVATGMKPNTQVYAFFDNTPVSVYVTQSVDSNGDPTNLDSNGEPITPATLITDQFGSVSGVFIIPDYSVQQFLCGERVFSLIDDPNNNTVTADSVASATYSAAGVLDTVQDTILSTVTSQVVQSAVSQSQTITESQVTSFTTPEIWVDPLAESFLINSPGGVFISSITVYFSQVDTGNIPVELQIRNMDGGFPGQNIVPFSDVFLNPSQVNVSVDASVGTTFTFPSPVYLQDGQTYCFVLLSNSNYYKVYCSNLGGTDILTGGLISQQPYAGTLFKSQNAQTWTPDQDEDIKFVINRCVFNTSTPATVVLSNPPLAPTVLGPDPITTTNGSDIININAPNHGLQSGQYTTIAGIVGAQNGIAAVDINGQHLVTVEDLDNFTVATGSGNNATSSGICGGGNVSVTLNIVVDVTNINIQNLTFPGTVLSWGTETTPVDGFLAGSYSGVTLSNNLSFLNPQVVYSPDNDPGHGSYFVQASMSTSNNSVSPVIDTTRTSAIVVSNRINYVLDSNGDAEGEDGLYGGSSLAKYVTKSVSLTTSATQITVYMDIVRPQPADIQVFVKYLPAQSSTLLDSLDYVRVPATAYPTFDPATPYEYTFQLADLTPFNNFAIKVVMLSSDESQPPLIQNFRAIATA